ncbi:MAG: 50S ribosomal protein L4 [Deltaproteobacteria bacterium]|nr:50S ribosomal protein L4 [Deltaproteobacteria bacterium]
MRFPLRARVTEAAMPKLKVRNLSNAEVGEINLNDEIFGVEVKYHLLHEIVRMQQNRKRSGTASTKERCEVAGGGKKPYRQKGTGRARQGSERAPNHVGGGTIFGPRPRSYDFSPPKRVRGGAMRSALSLFASEGRLIVVEDFNLPETKTHGLLNVLGTLGCEQALIVDGNDNEMLRMSARNLACHQYLPPEGLNVYDILRHDQLVMTRRAVLDVQERVGRSLKSRRAGA